MDREPVAEPRDLYAVGALGRGDGGTRISMRECSREGEKERHELGCRTDVLDSSSYVGR
jgi:hypothetical protein